MAAQLELVYAPLTEKAFVGFFTRRKKASGAEWC
jgi:hypothetical protein